MRAPSSSWLCVLLGVSYVLSPVSAQAGTCDDEYECIYESQTANNITFSFDLRPLCEQGTTYVTSDTSGHNYSFNICGTSSFVCIPNWQNVYETGVAVQYWGSPPPCNATTANCTNFEGQNVCCTQDCQVLGVGIPNWQLKSPSNPESGGVRITHIGVPPADDDPFWCPWNPNTGAMYERTITYDFTCNFSMPIGAVTVLGAEENNTNPCAYTIYLNSFHGCGCSPDCANKNCGPDGCGGYCGNPLNGECPTGYFCMGDGVCCSPDCNGRECGGDGCGGNCGNPTGQCGIGEQCIRNQCIPLASASPSMAPSAPPSVTPSPPPPYYFIVNKDDPGVVAGSFFGGLFTALFVGGVGAYVYRKRTGSYKYYSADGGSGGGAYASANPYASGVTAASSTGYGYSASGGVKLEPGTSGGSYGASTSGAYGTL